MPFTIFSGCTSTDLDEHLHEVEAVVCYACDIEQMARKYSPVRAGAHGMKHTCGRKCSRCSFPTPGLKCLDDSVEVKAKPSSGLKGKVDVASLELVSSPLARACARGGRSVTSQSAAAPRSSPRVAYGVSMSVPTVPVAMGLVLRQSEELSAHAVPVADFVPIVGAVTVASSSRAHTTAPSQPRSSPICTLWL